MHLRVTIHTTAVNGPDIQSLSGSGRMAWQHMNVALLANQVSTSGQKLGIVRTMRRMTVQAILADGWMIPEKWTTFFGMASVTDIVDGNVLEHPPRLTAMRIVAGSTTDFHVAKLGAKQVGGALKQRLSLFNVATEAGFLDGGSGQQVFRQSGAYQFGELSFGFICKTGSDRL
jgi:hypothetical protein